MADAHANFAVSAVATAPSPASSGTSLVVTAGQGARFPAVPFNATLCPAATQPDPSNAEIVRVTAISSDTLTITRAQEGTSARTVLVGDQIYAGITVKTLTDAETAVSSLVTTKGDQTVATGSGVLGRLAAGADGTSQIADSTQTTGAGWLSGGIFGDGSDGNVSITGGTTTLTKDMFYDTLTITSTGVLKTASFRVHCRTGCIVNSSGDINNNGNNGSGATAGTPVGTGTLGNSGAGGAGSTVAGAASGTLSSSLGAKGGAGGASGVGNSGGAAGNANAPSAAAGNVRSLPLAALGQTTAAGIINAGNGGGGGGGDTTNSGGGGGSGGGFMVINARTITNNGTIRANGGTGGNGVAGSAGGGGGGGGGVIIINSATALVGNAPTATGGTHGTKAGTGVNGSDGSNGLVLQNVWS